MPRILIAPDKFKGSLTARHAAEAMRTGFASIFPHATIECLPIADGGEGLLDAFQEAIGGEIRHLTTQDALGRDIKATILLTNSPASGTHATWQVPPAPVLHANETACSGVSMSADAHENANPTPSSPTHPPYNPLPPAAAVIESSQANGIAHLAPAERNPAHTHTFGVGTLILEAIRTGAQHLIVGLGGSATNDCGVGMARALGFTFIDEAGHPVTGGPLDFHHIHTITPPPAWQPPPITAACDVRNPLLGPSGATRVYGPQKGLRPEDADILELGHQRIAQAVTRSLRKDLATIPGAGAAGGLGFGLIAFCNATLTPGFDCIAQATRLEEKIRSAHLVVTGEGSLDTQTLEGKAPYGVATLARRHHIPVVAIAGRIDDPDSRLDAAFDAIASLTPGPITTEAACQNAATLLEAAAARLARALKLNIIVP